MVVKEDVLIEGFYCIIPLYFGKGNFAKSIMNS